MLRSDAIEMVVLGRVVAQVSSALELCGVFSWSSGVLLQTSRNSGAL